MPIREYECLVCGARVERIEFTPDRTIPECPRAVEHENDRRPMVGVISASSFALKGDGWCRSSKYDMPRRIVPD